MLAQVPKKLPDNSKRDLNFYILTEKISLKWHSGQVRGSFDIEGERVSPGSIFWAPIKKKSEIKILSIKKATTPPNVTLAM